MCTTSLCIHEFIMFFDIRGKKKDHNGPLDFLVYAVFRVIEAAFALLVRSR